MANSVFKIASSQSAPNASLLSAMGMRLVRLGPTNRSHAQHIDKFQLLGRQDTPMPRNNKAARLIKESSIVQPHSLIDAARALT